MSEPGFPSGRRVEVRCPVPVVRRDGTEHQGRLFMVLYLAEEDADRDHNGSVIELPCSWCKHQAQRAGQEVRMVLHRFTLTGAPISTLLDTGPRELDCRSR